MASAPAAARPGGSPPEIARYRDGFLASRPEAVRELVAILDLCQEVGRQALSVALEVASQYHAYDLESVRAVVLLGLGLEALRTGYRVRFVTAAALMNELRLARQELRVPKVLKQHAAFDLVARDEVRYVASAARGRNCSATRR